MSASWILAPRASEDFLISLHDNPLIAQLLYTRGIRTRREAIDFLYPHYDEHTHDPFLIDDMHRAVDRIVAAVTKKEGIAIYGDYDVDGVCGSAILYEFFAALGVPVEVYMNHRERDGYGLTAAGISSLADGGARLIITTDCGISNKQEVDVARDRGIDVIITDHHHVPENPADIPAAYAIIHPRVRADRYPFKDLAGGGTAFKLIQALIRTESPEAFAALKREGRNADGSPVNWEAFEKWLLEMVCISTIGDCMPLLGENRAFVRYGLMALNQTRRPGLRSLLEFASARDTAVTAHTIGFSIGPRLNAASRMEHGKTAFALLTAREAETAAALAKFLDEKNTERRTLTDRILREADQLLAVKAQSGAPILVAYAPNWPLGVLGLVAGKLCERYQRPVLLITDAHGTRAGTGRSVQGFHLTDFFRELEECFERFGGHAAAGGFALKPACEFSDFESRCQRAAEAQLSGSDFVQTLSIDASLFLREANLELAELLNLFEPHGQQNPRPQFLFKSCVISDMRAVGAGGRHLSLTVEQAGVFRRAIGFSFGVWIDRLQAGDRIDCVATVEKNQWNGRAEVQLSLVDIRQNIEV